MERLFHIGQCSTLEKENAVGRGDDGCSYVSEPGDRCVGAVGGSYSQTGGRTDITEARRRCTYPKTSTTGSGEGSKGMSQTEGPGMAPVACALRLTERSAKLAVKRQSFFSHRLLGKVVNHPTPRGLA